MERLLQSKRMAGQIALPPRRKERRKNRGAGLPGKRKSIGIELVEKASLIPFLYDIFPGFDQAMNSSRTIIIGDVHGCLEELEALLDKVHHRPGKDRLIFTGDLINKGPHSFEVLQRTHSLSAEVVMGNHEWKFLKYLKGGSPFSQGFEELKEQMGGHLNRWQEWLGRLPGYIEAKQFLVVHGGLVPAQHPSQTPISILCRIRTWDGEGKDLNNPTHPSWFELYDRPKLVVFGHWAQRGLVQRSNAIGLDTGCVYGNRLTAVVLPEKTLCQVPAKKIYKQYKNRM